MSSSSSGITYEQMRDLLRDHAAATRPSSASTTSVGDPTAFGKSLSDTAGKSDTLGKSFDKIYSQIENNINVWRDLSRTGASFSNDVVGMTAAAAGGRVELKDFASTIQKNSQIMTGFGSDITRGTEQFSRAMKQMYDERGPQIDQLRQMGFTNKELNEVLAMQAISIRGSNLQDKERNRIAIEGAINLANEMDKLAKLNGKTREESEKLYRDQQRDMQFDAALKRKLREIEDPAERIKFEQQARQQLLIAQQEGYGEMFKEMFATNGAVLSKEAAMQASLYSGTADAVRKTALTFSETSMKSTERDEQLASAARERAAAQVKEANDDTLLMYRSFGKAGGAVAETGNQMAQATNTRVRGLEAIAAKEGLNLQNQEDMIKAQRIQMEEYEKSKKGQNEAGEAVSGSTKAIINAEQRTKDFQAQLAETANLLEKRVNKALGDFADQVLGAKGSIVGLVSKEGANRGENFSQAVQRQMSGAADPREQATPVGAAIKGIYTGGKEIADGVKEGVEKLLPKRPTGTIGETGNFFEFPGSIVQMTRPDETVMTSDQMKNMARGMFLTGAAQSTSELFEKATRAAPIDMSKSLDLGKVAKDIDTTISSKTQEVSAKPATTPTKVEVTNWPAGGTSASTAAKATTAQPETKTETKTETKAEPVAPRASQASVRAVDNQIEAGQPKTDNKYGAGEFGEEAKLPFASMMDEFGSNFEKVYNDMQVTMGSLDLDAFNFNLEEINKELVNALPVVEVAEKQEEFKSKFTDSQRKLIDEYNGISDENRQFNIDRLEYHNNEDYFIRNKHDEIVNRLQLARNERELTEEEENQLSESTLIGAAADERITKRQEELDVLRNLDEYASTRKIEIAEISNATVLKANQDAMMEANEMFDILPDQAQIAKDNLMMEANEMFDILPDFAAEAKDNLMMEANEMFDILPDFAAEAKDAMMLEVNDIQSDIEDAMAGIDFVPIQVDDLLQQTRDNLMMEVNEIAEDITEAIPVDAVRDLHDTMMLEANEIASDIQDEFSSMIDDAAYSAGPGDASAAGIDFIADDIKNALPIDEFGGLAEAIEQQKTIERNTSGMDVQAEDGSIAKGVKINPETGERYYTDQTDKVAELSQAVEAAAPTATGGGFDLDSLSFGPNGMPIVKQAKAAASSIPAKKDTSEDDAEMKKFKRQNDTATEEKGKSESGSSTAKTAAASKESSLNDVVEGLKQLNTKIGTLTKAVEEGFTSQVRATKSAGAGNNLYKGVNT